VINNIKAYFECRLFGVCTYLGEKLDMPSSKIRLFFIYASFLTAGSPIIVYMTMAFIIKLKDYIKGRRSHIWDF
jgi:phage shock protein C